MNKELIRTIVIAMIFFGIGAVAAESHLNTFTLRADSVLTDYMGGNVTADKVNITGLIIQAGQVLGYYNESATDALLDDKANQSDLTAHIGNVTDNPHNVTATQIGAATEIHGHALGVSNVSGLQGILDNKYNISEVNTLLTNKSNTTHQHTIGDSNITAGINASKIGNGTVNNTEFGYLDGVASALQTQMNNKAASGHIHNGSDITSPVANATNADTVDGQHASSFIKMVTSSYTGDGTTEQAVDTGLSTLNALLIFTNSTNGNLYLKSETHSPTGAILVTATTVEYIDWGFSQGFSGGTFYVDDNDADSGPNTNGEVYGYWAWGT